MGNTLISNFREVVNKRPGSVALVNGEERITYGDLWKLVVNVSRYLNLKGLARGDRVAILVNNSIEYVAVYYGVLAAGGVAVALNTAAKYRDLSNWIDHCGAKWLVAENAHSDIHQLLERYKGQLHLLIVKNKTGVDLPEDVASLKSVLNNSMNGTRSDVYGVAGDDNAAIIYTSGTTGKPKGVTLSHDNLYKNTCSILEYLKLSEKDSIVNVLPFFYSYGNSILHTHLAVAAKIVLVNSMMFPKLVLEKIEKECVTGFSGVPSTYALLLNRAKIKDFDLSSLRYVTQAGGAMPPANIRSFMELVPNIDFFVMYGQTEATARLTYLEPNMLINKMGSVGKAIPGVTLEIRNKYGVKTEIDEIGEIYAKGDNIMRGYWCAPELTKSVVNKGWLRTGDLAHYDADDYIYIVGRSTDMIKTGANRVSPKDVEEVLAELSGVVEAAVVGVDDAIMGQMIKAYIVIDQHSGLNKRNVLAYCKANLAGYKIPKYIEFVEGLPKTSSGKVQRYKLN